ncbi:MAG: NTP transferase domain-containing protein [Ktedonobacteraceae bacterium]|nr:NTP transferase domain-containing protein [Ktedonobacteraceae bacterium]
MKHLHAVILAGGSGTRLWPLSTPSFPKQFLPLPSGNSMIQEALERVAPLTEAGRSWVITGRNMADLVEEHLPSIPGDHILREPMGRNSAAAIAWSAATIVRQDPEAVMAIFSSDHAIEDIETFRKALHLAYEQAEKGHLVTIGITPNRPETGYGYIQFANKVGEGHEHEAFRAERFVEKPDLPTAQHYLEDGHYVWNSGIFIWKASSILAEMREHLPDTAHKVERIATAMSSEQGQSLLDELWPTLQSISIDYAILEKSPNIVVIPAQIGWNDVGNWEQYGSLFPADDQGVRAVGEHSGYGTQNVVIYNNTSRRVFTIGVEDIIVVEMDDMTVICHKDHVQRVREVAEQQQKKK